MILITGGLGYLGGRIAECLTKSGCQVRIGSSRSNPHIPFPLRSCEIVEIDLSNNTSLEKACKGVTSIVHLAALNAQVCEEYPESALLINGLGTLKLLQVAEMEGVAKFLYISTVHVYGVNLYGRIYEDSLPRPLHPYSITHRIAEDYLLEADYQGKITGTVLRLTNVVGSPLSYDVNCWMLVVNDICKQVATTKQMELYSDESIQRDFIPISAVCSVICLLLEEKNNILEGEIVNLSSGVSLTLRELTSLISDRVEVVLDFKPVINFNLKKQAKKTKPLVISNEKLEKTCGKVNSDLSGEIDQLLLNCVQWFNAEKQ